MMRKLYERMLRAAESPRAPWILGLMSFVESSCFPIAPDVMLVPMGIAKPDRALFYGFLTTVTSVLGGIAGYAIGYFLFEEVGKPVLEAYGYLAQFQDFAQSYNDKGWWFVFAAGLTPLPYKIFTIASGLTAMNLPMFVAASIASRGLRFMGESALVWKFGAPVQAFLLRYAGAVTIALFALLLGGFALLEHVL